MNRKIPKKCLHIFLLLAISMVIKAQPTSPYSINWVNQTGVSANGVILIRTTATGSWNAGAISSNLLLSNTDGWMEFTAVRGADYMLGFAANNVFNYAEYAHSIHIDDNTNTATAREGGNDVSLGAFQTGDVFRISREGNVVKFYKNGEVVRTVGTSPALELKVKACIQVSGKSTPAITTSFDSVLILFGSVTGIDGNVGSGSITVAVSGGSVPYTYSWSSGEQTNSITNKPHGSYTVTVTDAVGRQQSRTYSLGYKINWVNQVKYKTESRWKHGVPYRKGKYCNEPGK